MDKKEEKVLVIGNGFDLYHYLPTRYIDFIRNVNRLIELENRSNLENCRYIRYLWDRIVRNISKIRLFRNVIKLER